MSVVFDQLRISDDGKRMYIDVHVNKAKYFKDVYIESIVVTTSDHVSESSLDIPDADFLYSEDFEDQPREISLVLTAADFIKRWESDPRAMNFKQSEMSSTLFFVFIKCNMEGLDASDPCLPCRFDEEVTVAVTFDENLLYQNVMCYIRQLADTCNVPNEFINYILYWNAFKAAIETEHYIVAADLFKKLFGKDSIFGCSPAKVSSNCGCHG